MKKAFALAPARHCIVCGRPGGIQTASLAVAGGATAGSFDGRHRPRRRRSSCALCAVSAEEFRDSRTYFTANLARDDHGCRLAPVVAQHHAGNSAPPRPARRRCGPLAGGRTRNHVNDVAGQRPPSTTDVTMTMVVDLASVRVRRRRTRTETRRHVRTCWPGNTIVAVELIGFEPELTGKPRDS
jgi:hypothetical protein